MLKYIFVFCLLFSNVLNLSPANATTYTNVKLKSCHDGDTCRFYINGVNTPVRFSGIDAPELRQAYGKQSRDGLRNFLQGKNVVLNCGGKSYNRKVCGVYVKPSVGSTLIDVQKVMVLKGYAWDAPSYSGGKYLSDMKKAQRAKVGLWALSNPQNPSDFRRGK